MSRTMPTAARMSNSGRRVSPASCCEMGMTRDSNQLMLAAGENGFDTLSHDVHFGLALREGGAGAQTGDDREFVASSGGNRRAGRSRASGTQI